LRCRGGEELNIKRKEDYLFFDLAFAFFFFGLALVFVLQPQVLHIFYPFKFKASNIMKKYRF